MGAMARLCQSKTEGGERSPCELMTFDFLARFSLAEEKKEIAFPEALMYDGR
jgi:hypothetical protein